MIAKEMLQVMKDLVNKQQESSEKMLQMVLDQLGKCTNDWCFNALTVAILAGSKSPTVIKTPKKAPRGRPRKPKDDTSTKKPAESAESAESDDDNDDDEEEKIKLWETDKAKVEKHIKESVTDGLPNDVNLWGQGDSSYTRSQVSYQKLFVGSVVPPSIIISMNNMSIEQLVSIIAKWIERMCAAAPFLLFNWINCYATEQSSNAKSAQCVFDSEKICTEMLKLNEDMQFASLTKIKFSLKSSLTKGNVLLIPQTIVTAIGETFRTCNLKKRHQIPLKFTTTKAADKQMKLAAKAAAAEAAKAVAAEAAKAAAAVGSGGGGGSGGS
jgi:hypothetical protein